MKILLALGAASLFTSIAAAAGPPAYDEGQVWEYRTRPQDSGSWVKIQKIETLAETTAREPIYHVTIIGVRFEGTPVAGGVIGHLPVSRQTLDASVTRLAAGSAARSFEGIHVEEGIAEWRRAKGGVFTISLGEIVDVVERTMRQAAPQTGRSF